MEVEIIKVLLSTGIVGAVAVLAIRFALKKDKSSDDAKDKASADQKEAQKGCEDRVERQAMLFAATVKAITDAAQAAAEGKDKRHAEQLAQVTEMFTELLAAAHAEQKLLAEQLKAVAEVLSRKSENKR